MSVEVTGLTQVEQALQTANVALLTNLDKAVKVSATKIKQSAQAKVRGYAHLPQYPNSISYDVRKKASGASADIGPDKNRAQGPLGNLIEYGSRKNAPIPHLGPALDENADDFVHGCEIALEQAMELLL